MLLLYMLSSAQIGCRFPSSCATCLISCLLRLVPRAIYCVFRELRHVYLEFRNRIEEFRNIKREGKMQKFKSILITAVEISLIVRFGFKRIYLI